MKPAIRPRMIQLKIPICAPRYGTHTSPNGKDRRSIGGLKSKTGLLAMALVARLASRRLRHAREEGLSRGSERMGHCLGRVFSSCQQKPSANIVPEDSKFVGAFLS